MISEDREIFPSIVVEFGTYSINIRLFPWERLPPQSTLLGLTDIRVPNEHNNPWETKN
jgi:hypothetical protein